MNRVKEINSFITLALQMAKKVGKNDPNRENHAYVAAMNWLTFRAGLRVLTPLDKKQAEKFYGIL